MGAEQGGIDPTILARAARALYDEAYSGPKDAKGTWFVDNEPKCGILGVLEQLTAEQASRQLHAPDPATVASHAGHVWYSLSLANRAARGENPYPTANWKKSWERRVVTGGEWAKLVGELRAEYEAFGKVIESGSMWSDEDLLTGTFALIAHGAWHLGAIRQGLGLVRAPEE